MPLPSRPRLHDDVVVRRHVTDDGSWVVLHDHESHRVLRALDVQWRVIALADGTRDLDGLLIAARAQGITIGRDDLERFLERLAEDGLLVDGAPEGGAAEQATNDALRDAPLDVLPGFRFRCDAKGLCCHVFPSILFSPLEVARALVTLPSEAHEFFPHRGGAGAGGPVAPPLRDGCCTYLDDDGLCRLHKRGGMDAKPVGCAMFPLALVYDGEQVRVSTALECSCVVEGVGREDGSPLVPEDARTLGDLPRSTHVAVLPDELRVSWSRVAPLAEARRWFRALYAAPPPEDVAHGLFSLADAVSAEGLTEASVDAYTAPRPIDGARVRASIAQLEQALRGWRAPLATFRSERDLTRRAFEWLAEAASLLLAEPGELGRPAPTRPALEAFYVRADAHGCRYGRSLPIEEELRVRAIRLWLARALPRLSIESRHAREPLALVEVIFRAHGLDAFARREP